MTEIQTIDPNELTPYEGNSNQHSKSQIAGIAKSIEEFGFNSPIVVNEKMQIKAGHGRWEAAKVLKLKTVPIIQRNGLTESQWKAYVIADNKLNRNSTWDDDMLQKELESLIDEDYDLSITGFSGQEINELLLVNDIEPEHKGNPDALPVVKKDEPPVSKLGQVWQLGNHRFMCGDATNAEHVETLMDGSTAQLMWTEPPFNPDGDDNQGKTIENDSLTNEIFKQYIVSILANSAATMDKGAPFYVSHKPWHCRTFLNAIKDAGLMTKQQLIWIMDKTAAGRQDYNWQHEQIEYGWKPGAKHTFNGVVEQTTAIETLGKEFDKMTKKELIEWIENTRSFGTVKSVPMEDKPKERPRGKPIRLIKPQIENSSNPGDIVIDFTAGTGATIIACELSIRRCYAMEYDPRMADIILQRFRDFTKQEPILCG